MQRVDRHVRGDLAMPRLFLVAVIVVVVWLCNARLINLRSKTQRRTVKQANRISIWRDRFLTTTTTLESILSRGWGHNFSENILGMTDCLPRKHVTSWNGRLPSQKTCDILERPTAFSKHLTSWKGRLPSQETCDFLETPSGFSENMSLFGKAERLLKRCGFSERPSSFSENVWLLTSAGRQYTPERATP